MTKELVLRRHRWVGVLHDRNLMCMLYEPTLAKGCCPVVNREKGDLDDFECVANAFARAARHDRAWVGYENWIAMARYCRDTQSPRVLRALADLLNAMGVKVPETVSRADPNQEAK